METVRDDTAVVGGSVPSDDKGLGAVGAVGGRNANCGETGVMTWPSALDVGG